TREAKEHLVFVEATIVLVLNSPVCFQRILVGTNKDVESIPVATERLGDEPVVVLILASPFLTILVLARHDQTFGSIEVNGNALELDGFLDAVRANELTFIEAILLCHSASRES